MKNLKNSSKNASCKISVGHNPKYLKPALEHQYLLNLLKFINREQNKRPSKPPKTSNHALINLLNETLEAIKRNSADVSIKKI